MRCSCTLLLGACVAFGLSVGAAADESRVITVEEAVALAIGQNAGLQAARARLEGWAGHGQQHGATPGARDSSGR
jgi:hypothetical protein